MPKINEMFAFISTDKDAEDEGITAWNFIDVFKGDNNWAPLLGADQARVESLKPYAQHIADATGKTILFVKFSCRTELETMNPKPEEPKTVKCQ
jgi:hypothetical protein